MKRLIDYLKRFRLVNQIVFKIPGIGNIYKKERIVGHTLGYVLKQLPMILYRYVFQYIEKSNKIKSSATRAIIYNILYMKMYNFVGHLFAGKFYGIRAEIYCLYFSR